MLVLSRERNRGVGPFPDMASLTLWAQQNGLDRASYTVLVVEPPVGASRLTVIQGGDEPPPAA